jgi:hypothetical protein
MFELSDSIAIPSTQGHVGKEKYPLGTMDKGQSFFVPASATTPFSLRRTITVAARRHSRKFITRTTTENGVIGLRVWRVF